MEEPGRLQPAAKSLQSCPTLCDPIVSEGVNCYLPLFFCTGESRSTPGTGRFNVQSIGGSEQQPVKFSIS